MCVCVSQPLGVALRGEQLEFAPRNSPLGAYQGPWLRFGMSQTPSEQSKAEPALPKPRPHKKKTQQGRQWDHRAPRPCQPPALLRLPGTAGRGSGSAEPFEAETKPVLIFTARAAGARGARGCGTDGE